MLIDISNKFSTIFSIILYHVVIDNKIGKPSPVGTGLCNIYKSICTIKNTHHYTI